MAHVRKWLEMGCERLTPELANWAPNPGMRTVASQLVEIITVELPLVPLLREGKVLDDAEALSFVGDAHDLFNLQRKLEEVRLTTLEYLDSITSEELAEDVSREGPWFGTFWRSSMPRAEYFLNIAEHEFYHVGQIYSYLWCRGDNPYDW